MAAFTTRVELHNATWDDYVRLHQAMRGQGFTTTITSDAGETYDLPPAEYNFEGQATLSAVVEKAKRAAASVKSSFAVLVTEAVGRSWFGLTKTRRVA